MLSNDEIRYTASIYSAVHRLALVFFHILVSYSAIPHAIDTNNVPTQSILMNMITLIFTS